MASFKEKKGSLSLRSDHMDYDRSTLVSMWHARREQEETDHDVHCPGCPGCRGAHNRTLHMSSYNQLGTYQNEEPLKSTCHDHLDQINLRKDFEEKVTRKPMINETTINSSPIALDKKLDSAILPKHLDDHSKRYLDTTYGVDYKQSYPGSLTSVAGTQPGSSQAPPAEVDKKGAYQKMRSQFTDVDGHKREGANTWHDESGVYANAELKSQVFEKTAPILERM